ncbi:MAG: hypothetical protein ACREUW_00095 [Burkholderiales bacterium]
MKPVLGLAVLLLAACATPSDITKLGMSRSFTTTMNVPNTVTCVKRVASDFRAKGPATERPSDKPGGVEIHLNGDMGTIMVAVVTPAPPGSNVTVFYESDRVRSLNGNDMVRGCSK